MSKAVIKKLERLRQTRPSACTSTSRASLQDKLVTNLGIDYRQLPRLLQEAKLKIVEDPTTNEAKLMQAS